MKKIVFFCLVIGFQYSFSKTTKLSKLDRYLGLSMGSNFAYARMKSDNYNISTLLFPRLHAGLFYQAHPTIRYSIKLGAQYSAKGAHFKNEQIDYKLRVDYINVFSLGTFSIFSSKRKIDPYVAGGLYFGAAVGGNIRMLANDEIYGVLRLTRENIASTDMGVKIGFGVNFKIKQNEKNERRAYKLQLQLLQSNSFFDSHAPNEESNHAFLGKRKLKAIESKVTFLIPIR